MPGLLADAVARCLNVYAARDRDGVLAFLTTHAASWTHGHLCDDVESIAGDRWRQRAHLIPAIEPGGRIGDEGLSSRQISRIVAIYLDLARSKKTPNTNLPGDKARRPKKPLTVEELRAQREDLKEWVATLETATDRAAAEFDAIMRRIPGL